MGFYLIGQTTLHPAESKFTSRPRPGAKKELGAPFLNPILSSKYWDEDTKLAYYGYRYYHPDEGRWLSSDPMTDNAFVSAVFGRKLSRRVRERVLHLHENTYLFVRNDPIGQVDLLGLITVTGPCGQFTTDQVKGALESAFNTYINSIREPLQQTMRDNWANMAFTCRGNDHADCMWTENGGLHTARGMASVGVLRDVTVTQTGTTPGGGSYDITVLHRKNWNTTASLCRCQITTLDQYGKTGFHEAAHAVGWGGYYKDDDDTAFDNMSVPPRKHPTGWGVPGEGD